ncbi:MAG: twitching motility protein PilT [Segetibacter sp.]|nr:twitching motility protein PilT [Segetibacter sp.]
MRVFVDANILVSILNKEYPLFTYSSRILSLAGSAKYEIVTSPICLAIAFYFAEKKFKAVKAKEKIGLLCRHIKIAEATKISVQKALENKAVLDFEDGLEYYVAEENDCVCIVTEDVGDFHISKIEVMHSEAFFEKYMKTEA